jgi:hypothetical protein
MQMILPALQDTSGRPPAQELDDGGTRTRKLARNIYRNHRVPLRERHLLKRHITLQSGVVDEDVDRPQPLHHRAEHLPDLSFVGHVRATGVSLDTVLLDGTDHLLGTILACDIIDHNIGAGLTQRDRHGLADTGICPGDQSLLSGERSRDRCIGF